MRARLGKVFILLAFAFGAAAAAQAQEDERLRKVGIYGGGGMGITSEVRVAEKVYLAVDYLYDNRTHHRGGAALTTTHGKLSTWALSTISVGSTWLWAGQRALYLFPTATDAGTSGTFSLVQAPTLAQVTATHPTAGSCWESIFVRENLPQRIALTSKA